jgi:predicted permease
VDAILQDLRYAVRSLRKSPGFASAVIAALALGIGANTAIFTLVNSLILRPLPVTAPERLVTITTTTAVSQGWRWTWNYPVWEQIRRRPELFDGSIAFSFDRFNLNTGGESLFAEGVWVNSGFFHTLGVAPLIGVTFQDGDDARGVGPDGAVAVISHRFWQRHFNRARDVVGRAVTLDGIPFTIIGVTPAWFFGPEVGHAFDIAVPLAAGPLVRGAEMQFDSHSAPSLTVIARLKPGETRQRAINALRSVQRPVWEATLSRGARPEYRQQYLAQTFDLVPAATGESNARRAYGRPLITLMVVVALVLVLACGNVANLMLARGAVRRGELSLHLALGASRLRVVHQLVAESLLLATVGTAAGWVLASWSSRLLLGQLTTSTNVVSLDLSIDGRVLLFTAFAAAATVLFFGVMPAVKVSDVAPVDALRQHGCMTNDGGGMRIARSVVVAQVALSLVLVTLAGLFVQTFASLVARPLGFDRDRVLLATVDARRGVPPNERVAFAERLRPAMRAIPDVSDAAVSLTTPVSGQGFGPRIEIPGGRSVAGNVWGVNGMTNIVSPGFFMTLGTAIVAGRDFTDADAAEAPRVAVVNETLVRSFLGTEDPLGRTVTLTLPSRSVSMEVVGVVADAVYMSVREAIQPTVYSPLAQSYLSPATLMPLTISLRPRAGSPARLSRAVTQAIVSLRPDATVTFTSLREQVDSSLTQERVVAMLSACFAGLALLLATVGLYGLTAYAVAHRTREIGIRLALGAEPRGVVRLITSEMATLVALGVAVGVLAIIGTSRFVGSLLYGVRPQDPTTVTTAVIALAAVALIAAWLPARRAARVDPMIALRAE